jgi:ectoine hydroxylase-related dioxygenase (phytanoyl-CoA dioxygenase family)
MRPNWQKEDEPVSRRMDPAGLYHFDCRGFLPRDQVLSKKDVALFTRLLQARWPAEEDDGFKRLDGLPQLAPEFADLSVRLARELAIYDLVNQPLRLIESYALHRIAGSVQTLHNGMSNANVSALGTSSRAMWRYHTHHDGKLYCMMVKVLVYLTDVVTDEDAPFCLVEGSHKSNYQFPLPPAQVKNGSALTSPGISTVFRRAGDALVVNEALMHGTFPKRSDLPRVVMAFSYSPSFVQDYQKLPRTVANIWSTGFCE